MFTCFKLTLSHVLIHTDVEECAQPGSPCDQLCLNLEGGYRCGCREGYELMEDGRCEGEHSIVSQYSQ